VADRVPDWSKHSANSKLGNLGISILKLFTFVRFTFTSVGDSVHLKLLATLTDAVIQKMIEELLDADARVKWAQYHISAGFTG